MPRWSPRGCPWPRGHNLKSLALASKPQVLENCPVLGSRAALFLNRWNFVGKRQKPCGKSAKTFCLVSSDRLKNFFEDLFFFWRTLASVSLALASKFFCVLGLGLEPCVLDSTSAILYYEHNILWSKFRIITASDSQSICALRYAWATRKLLTICCLHERDFALWLSRRWSRPRVSDHERERFLHRVAQNIIGIANRRCYLHGGDSCQTRSRQASLVSCE